MAERKAKAPYRQIEDGIQKAFTEWCASSLYRETLSFSIPNEGAQGRSGRLKGMGLRAGAADYVLIEEGRAYFIEFKSPGGTQGKKQIKFEEDAIRAGARYGIARSVGDAIRLMNEWDIPHRDKSMWPENLA